MISMEKLKFRDFEKGKEWTTNNMKQIINHNIDSIIEKYKNIPKLTVLGEDLI